MDTTRYREAETRLWASLGVAPTERLLSLDRTAVRIRILEAGDGPTIVFVHGGSSAGTSWAPLVAALSGFRCVLVDRPGCGLSDPVATRFEEIARFEAFADAFVVDVLDALGVESAHLAATSYGGYIALRSAAAHPARIERLITFGFSIGLPMDRVPFVMRLGTVPVLGRLMASIPPTERAVRAIYKQIGLGDALANGRISSEALGWFLALLRDTDTMRNELDAGPRVITPLHGLNEAVLLPDALLAKVVMPTYLLWGEQDPFGGAASARSLAARLPNATLELVPGGHAVWIDDPDHAAATTRRFLSA